MPGEARGHIPKSLWKLEGVGRVRENSQNYYFLRGDSKINKSLRQKDGGLYNTGSMESIH